jgi:hypothetical protein
MIEYYKTYIWLKWFWIKSWVSSKFTTVPIECGLCGLETDQYDIMKYKCIDETYQMKICPSCANILEQRAKQDDTKSI